METTMKIKVLDKTAIPLLEDMAERHLVRLEPGVKARCTWQLPVKPSEYFAGGLNLNDSQYEAFQQALVRYRNEWERAIS
jgi:hypothetical protein